MSIQLEVKVLELTERVVKLETDLAYLTREVDRLKQQSVPRGTKETKGTLHLNGSR